MIYIGVNYAYCVTIIDFTQNILEWTMVQITHNLNSTRVWSVCATCTKAKNMHGIKPYVYMCVK